MTKSKEDLKLRRIENEKREKINIQLWIEKQPTEKE